ncbi:hypothetical protein [Mucilaginibacter aquatilis]|uniref:Beta-lactamase-inhibitor-like PepSY-like domain-containing protein n=1 Tax=Mucilaginibacter aquatilis TaxID=1517760 RepID=A0A6I4ICA1_9SPHI|nr:hypothetical protein [Mucilaginibacter aquatilis]MVN92875.1 hypothetical protein [Mucilaginibacter aquatilis]
MKLFLILFISVFVSHACLAQSNADSIEIKKIELKGDAFKNALEKFIEDKTADNSSFSKGRGFVIVRPTSSYPKLPPNTSAIFYVNVDYYELDNAENDRMYPSSYAISSSGRLIMMYEKWVSRERQVKYTADSKAKLRAELEPFLPKYKMIPAFNDSTKLVKFREENSMQLHGGKYFFVLNDGSVVVKDARSY